MTNEGASIEVRMWQDVGFSGQCTGKKLSMKLSSCRVLHEIWVSSPTVPEWFFGTVFEVTSCKWAKHRLPVPCLPDFTDIFNITALHCARGVLKWGTHTWIVHIGMVSPLKYHLMHRMSMLWHCNFLASKNLVALPIRTTMLHHPKEKSCVGVLSTSKTEVEIEPQQSTSRDSRLMWSIV